MKTGERKKEIFIIIFSVFTILLLVSITSAGVFDWLKKTITGRAQGPQPQNISITVSGVNPVEVYVWNYTLTGAAADPLEESPVDIIFNVTVTDPDGIGDINDDSVKAKLTRGSVTRENPNACTLLGENTLTSKNYTCSVEMWYWDADEAWIINVTANDKGNKANISNDSTTFTYNTLQSMKIDPELVTWASVTPGDTNQTANEYVTLNNTGNYDATGNLEIEAIDLFESTGTNFIGVGNITVDVETGGSPPAECDGTRLQNATGGAGTNIAGVVLAPGNLSAGQAQENLYYCLMEVPITIPSGIYGTEVAGSWFLEIV